MLVKRLFSDDGIERQEARHRLVKIGKPVISFLVGLQYLHQHRVSWEAVKTLSEMADPDSIPILINALENDDPDIRWLAAEGLINIGEPSLMPVLEALELRGGSMILREMSCPVLRALKEKGIFTDDYNLIGMLKNSAKQMLVAPTAAIIHMQM
ncbi:MAG: HEAT repeat domain-containing protein, partial [Candidatus Kryptoniota bacterium]